MSNRTRQLNGASAPRSTRRRGFTLIELLVVVGIIAVLSGMTALSYRAIAKDAKLATGKNLVAAVLDQARSLAMKNNRIVMVVFRPRFDGPKKQFIEATFAQWSGESYPAMTGTGIQVVDRFVPIPNVASRALPSGIKIGSPNFHESLDDQWLTCSHLPNINPSGSITEASGVMIAVMFASDGTTLSMNPAMDSARAFVDFDNDQLQDVSNATVDYRQSPEPNIADADFYGGFFEQTVENEEVYVIIAPYLCVFDDDNARELYDTTRWLSSDPQFVANRLTDYSAYLTQNADRIHFNRYTGVVMK